MNSEQQERGVGLISTAVLVCFFVFFQCFCGGGMDLPRASRHSIYFPGIALIVEYPVGQIFKDWRLVLPRIR